MLLYQCQKAHNGKENIQVQLWQDHDMHGQRCPENGIPKERKEMKKPMKKAAKKPAKKMAAKKPAKKMY